MNLTSRILEFTLGDANLILLDTFLY